MRNGFCLVLCGCSLAAASHPQACNSPQFNTPTLRAQGTTADQRLQAQQFDPFPDPNTSTDFAGSRPRDFDIPRPPPRFPPAQALPVAPSYAPPMVLSGPAQPYSVSPAPSAVPYVAPYAPPAPAVVAPPVTPAGPIYSTAPSPIATPSLGYDPYATPH